MASRCAARCICAGACSEYNRAMRGSSPCSCAISSAMSRVQSTASSQPEVPHEPISSGTLERA